MRYLQSYPIKVQVSLLVIYRISILVGVRSYIILHTALVLINMQIITKRENQVNEERKEAFRNPRNTKAPEMCDDVDTEVHACSGPNIITDTSQGEHECRELTVKGNA